MADLQALVEENLGPLCICLLLSCMMFGAAAVQTFVYYRWHPSDQILFKAIVGSAMLFNTLQTIISLIDLYSRLISHFGNPLALSFNVWTAPAQPLVAALSDTIVRLQVFFNASFIPFSFLSSFFARRVVVLCGNKNRSRKIAGIVLGTVIVILSINVLIFRTIFSFTNYAVYKLPAGTEIALRQKALQGNLRIAHGCSATVDIIITVSICSLLYISRTGFKRTDSLVTHIATLSISSGFISSVFALSSMLCYVVANRLIAGWAISYLLCQIHINALLLSLNTRHMLRELSTPSNWSNNGFAFNHNGQSDPSKNNGSFAIPLQNTQGNVKLAITKEIVTYTDQDVEDGVKTHASDAL